MSFAENPITVTQSDTHRIEIYIAGSRAAATEALREFCMVGLCVNVSDADYVYTGGLEGGVRVGLINYPRFPKSRDDLLTTALELAKFLIAKLHQQSCTVVADHQTFWLSRR